MKQPIQLKDGKVILDIAHITGVLEKDDFDIVTGNISYNLDIILVYDGHQFSQTLTYPTEEARQYEMNRLVLALPEEE